jgi:NADH-quinone oxidoreductase subunit G
VADEAARRALAEEWGVEELPAEEGLDGPAMVRAAAEGKLGVLLLAGVDLLRDYGPGDLAREALRNAFVIAIDHHITDTTRHADVLLPGNVHAETHGTFTDWEGRVQETYPAVPVGGAAQAVWELADQLAIRLGSDLGLATYDRVAAETELARVPPQGLPPVAVPEGGSQTPAGPADGLALVTYPLLLDGASLLARAADLNRETPGAFVELHPDDATRLRLRDGDKAETSFGKDSFGGDVKVTLPVRVASWVAPGCAFIPFNQPDLSLGELLGPAPSLRVAVRAAKEVAA